MSTAVAPSAAVPSVDPHAPCARLSTVNGVVVAVNAAAARLFGRAAAQLVDVPFTQWLTPSSAMLWEAQFRPLLMVRGTVDGGFLTAQTAAGEELPILVAASARHEATGLHVELALLPARQRVAFEQALRTARDEAEHARAASEAAHAALAESVARREAVEAQLRQAQKLEAVGRLAGGIAHDFNNLLAVLGGHLEEATAQVAALPDAALPGAARPALGAELAAVRLAADRAAGVVRQLLAFSRQQVLAPGPLDLGATVRGAEPLLRRALGPDVAWDVALDASAPPVIADRGQLEQVLLNLVLNARDAVAAVDRPGAVAVHVTAWTDDPVADGGAPRRWVRLRVADSGVGMDEATRARAFEPFFTTKGVEGGSGLGLAMVYGIVHQSQGRVRLESTPGAGTHVVIDLPAADDPAAPPPPPAPDADSAPRPHEAMPARERAALPPATVADDAARDTATDARPGRAAAPRPGVVLLVEDESSLRRIAQRILERAGFAVLACADGAAALAAWREHRARVTAVVSDVRMPAMDGHALRDALRREAPALPILLVSGYTEQPVLDRGTADGFLEKPFAAAGLIGALRTLGVAGD